MAPLLDIERVSKRFPVAGGQFAQAVCEVSLALAAGETLALVGESGSGKTTLARIALGLLAPDEGSVRFEGRVLDRGSRKRIGAVFQDPAAALNPRLDIARSLTEPLDIHNVGDRAGRRARALELLESVGLAAEHLDRYPHEFSGGQLQRICIARALALSPALIVADEPVSALDVSVRSQILNLLLDLQRRHAIACLFVGHDLAVVSHVADRVAVMYLGRIVEAAPAAELFAGPRHPYTRALIAAAPEPGRRQRPAPLAGETPSPISPPAGCPFHPRCPKVQAICRETLPPLAPAGAEPGHLAACHFPEAP